VTENPKRFAHFFSVGTKAADTLGWPCLVTKIENLDRHFSLKILARRPCKSGNSLDDRWRLRSRPGIKFEQPAKVVCWVSGRA
jgi:hypothetical protein